MQAKKILSIALALAMVCSLLTGCSKSRRNDDQSSIGDSVMGSSDLAQNGDYTDEYILGVMNGHTSDYPDISYAKAFESFFESPKWRHFAAKNDSGNDVEVVEFTGRCQYNQKDVEALLQFVVDPDSGTFSAEYLSLDDDTQKNATLETLISKVFEDYDPSQDTGNGTFTGGAVPSSLENETPSGETETPDVKETVEEPSLLEKAKGCNRTAEEYQGHVYAIFNIQAEYLYTYDECEEFCKEMGGHLAVIESKEENDFIYSFIQQHGLTLCFFGYSDQDEEGKWKWANGSTSSWTNWAEGQPNNGANNKGGTEEHYAEFFKTTADGTWNDAIFGQNTYHFVCEWE